jgi:hypothetical protein
METRADGYSYFIDYGHPDDNPRVTTEFKFKQLSDGNVEAYNRDISNPLLYSEFSLIHTMIKPDGSQNIPLKTFCITLNNHLNLQLSKRLISSTGVAIKMPKSSQFSLNLRNDLRALIVGNGLNASKFINEAIAEKLEYEGLL